jgi:hypothetical protein
VGATGRRANCRSSKVAAQLSEAALALIARRPFQEPVNCVNIPALDKLIVAISCFASRWGGLSKDDGPNASATSGNSAKSQNSATRRNKNNNKNNKLSGGKDEAELMTLKA